jgi:hypothetical protein
MILTMVWIHRLRIAAILWEFPDSYLVALHGIFMPLCVFSCRRSPSSMLLDYTPATGVCQKSIANVGLASYLLCERVTDALWLCLSRRSHRRVVARRCGDGIYY